MQEQIEKGKEFIMKHLSEEENRGEPLTDIQKRTGLYLAPYICRMRRNNAFTHCLHC